MGSEEEGNAHKELEEGHEWKRREEQITPSKRVDGPDCWECEEEINDPKAHRDL